MTDRRDPAFGFDSYNKGLTKREYFAALAMHGLLACGGMAIRPKELADYSVLCAEELIDKLSKDT